MSDLLERLRRRRGEQIRIAAYPGDDYCAPGTYPVWNDLIKEYFCEPIPPKPTTSCACGQRWEFRGDLARWVCVTDPDFPPPPTCEPGETATLSSTCQWMCVPDPAYVPECPPGQIPEWQQPPGEDGFWRCVTDPAYVPPPTPPDPENPSVSFTEWTPNVGTKISELVGGRGRIENILRTRIQMGNEFGLNKGWYKVTFPFEMLNPRVIATSGPRSAKEPVAEIRFAARAEYVTRFYKSIAYELLHPIQEMIPTDPFGIENWIFNAILYPLVESLGKFIGELIYDTIVRPQMELLEQSLKSTLPILPEMWGLGRERSIHQVDIRNITTLNFEWYSYGNMYINWIAIGTCTEEETPLPPELQNLINQMNELQTIIDGWEGRADNIVGYVEQLEAKIQEIVDRIGGVQPVETKRRFKLFSD